jgi:hypothetical protein
VVALLVLALVAFGWMIRQRQSSAADERAYKAMQREQVLSLQPPNARLTGTESRGPCEGDSSPGPHVFHEYATGGQADAVLSFFREHLAELGWSEVRTENAAGSASGGHQRLTAIKRIAGRDVAFEASTIEYGDADVSVGLLFYQASSCGLLPL